MNEENEENEEDTLPKETAKDSQASSLKKTDRLQKINS